MAMHASTVFACPEGDQPLAGLISEYRAELVRRRRSERHVLETVRYLERLTLGVETLEELTVERIVAALAAIPGAGRAQNLARVALSALFEWLRKLRRVAWNPLEAVAPVRVVQCRHRRALEREELEALVATAPRYRGSVYLVAATTGLRRSELAGLTWADFSAESRLLAVPAEVAKSRRKRLVPLPVETVERLERERGGLLERDPLFVSGVPSVKTLYRDLERAGVARETVEGVFDFHAFRVTYASLLEEGRVSLKVRQGLLDHSKPEITLNVYTRARLRNAQAQVDRAFGSRGEERRAA